MIAHMASVRSFSIKEVAENVGLTLQNLMITCYYCSKWLTHQEKIIFDHSQLLVVWKQDLPYACCPACIRTSSRLDFLLGFVRAVPHCRFAELCSYPWETAVVRCLVCLRKLNEAEKREIENGNLLIFLVKQSLRAHCCLCRIGL